MLHTSPMSRELPTGPGCVIGTGDLGREVLDSLVSRSRRPEIRGLFKAEFDTAPIGSWMRDVPVLGPLNVLPRYRHEIEWAVVAVASASEREFIIASLEEANITVVPAVHPDATVSAAATICSGAIVGARAVIGAEARVGRSAVCGAGCIIETGAVLGDFAELGAGALLGRRARAGERVEIGAGALVREETLIGPDARIQMGAVVTQDIRAGACVGFEAERGSTRPELGGVV